MPPSETFEEYWNRIGSGILDELERRLGEDADARDLPGTLLMNLAQKYLVYLEKKAENDEGEQNYMSALEAIEQEGLSLDSKIEILQDYISKLEEDHNTATNRLEELMKEQHGLPQMHEPTASV